MEKNRSIGLIVLSALFFLSCSGSESQSASMNEDYAGTWYFSFIIISRLDMTDIDYQFDAGIPGYGYYPFEKGDIEKLSDTRFLMTPTAMSDGSDWYKSETEWADYLASDGTYTEEEAAEEAAEDFEATTVTYSLSADGRTLTLNGLAYSSTEP